MEGKKFQVTTFDVHSAQFSRVADRSIICGLSWEDVCKRMTESRDANVDYALHAMSATGRYSFHNKNGELCQVRPQVTEEA
jgi:hypothetical protein